MIMALALSSVFALEVIEAKFGVDNRWADVRDEFMKLKRNDDLYLGYIDGNKMAGKDPAPKVGKKLVVKYKDNDGSIKTVALTERTVTGISANVTPSKDFSLGQVWFGWGNNYVNITENMKDIFANRKEVTLNFPTLKITSDPAPGKKKDIIIFYSIDGEIKSTIVFEKDKFHPGMIDGGLYPIPLAKEVKSPFTDMELDKAVWQWSIPVSLITSKENDLPPVAYLYIPPKTKKLRGVVIGQFNMLERPILENEVFRQGLADLDYGAIWIGPSLFGSQFNFRDPKEAAAVESIFTEFAKISGYSEIKDIPFIGLGHSAMADFPYQLAAWKPERAIAGISYDGSVPNVEYNYDYGKNPILNDDAITRIYNIPFLIRSGGLGGNANFRGVVVRSRHPQFALTTLADPASGHFDINDPVMGYIVQYLKKVDALRGVGKMPLNKIDTSKGWAVDYWRYNNEPKVKAAPMGEFQAVQGRHGKEANFVLDEEHAKFHEEYEARYRGKKVQLLGYEQDGQVLPDRKTHLQIHPKFTPEKDGQTFKLKGTFIDTVTDGRAPGWVHRKVGETVEHGSDVENIHIYPICGPVVRIDNENMAVRFDRFGFTKSRRTGEICMIAVHEGDDTYRRAVLQSTMGVPVFNTKGTMQRLTFPDIKDVKADTKSIKLDAFVNTGLPVEYFVNYGPAYLKNGELIFTEIPASAKYPVEVSVTAYQYGVRDKIQSATPITRTFNILK